jgi:hypothetical protein
MRTLALATRTGVLAATTGALLFTGAAAQGTALAAPQAPKAKLTVQDYRAFLKKGGGSSATLLKSFDRLPKAKQQKFVGYLQSAAVQKAFDAALGGYVTTSKRNWEAYNKDVRFTGDVRAVTKSDKAGRHTTLTFTATESIYNLPVITHKSVLSYTYRRRRLQDAQVQELPDQPQRRLRRDARGQGQHQDRRRHLGRRHLEVHPAVQVRRHRPDREAADHPRPHREVQRPPHQPLRHRRAGTRRGGVPA